MKPYLPLIFGALAAGCTLPEQSSPNQTLPSCVVFCRTTMAVSEGGSTMTDAIDATASITGGGG